MSRRHLETDRDIDRVALGLLPALDGLSLAQVRVVLRRCEDLASMGTVFDDGAPDITRWREALAEHGRDADE